MSNEVVVRRSWVDRVISVAMIVVAVALVTLAVATYVQRMNHPTVVFYCTNTDCATPDKFWQGHHVDGDAA